MSQGNLMDKWERTCQWGLLPSHITEAQAVSVPVREVSCDMAQVANPQLVTWGHVSMENFLKDVPDI